MNKFLVGLLLLATSVWTEPSLEEIQNLRIEDIKKINVWMNDKNTAMISMIMQ